MKIDNRNINYRRCSGRYFVRGQGFIEFKLGYFHQWGEAKAILKHCGLTTES